MSDRRRVRSTATMVLGILCLLLMNPAFVENERPEYVTTGTAIAIVARSDQIAVAADSKVLLGPDRFSSTDCKIQRCEDDFFVIAGHRRVELTDFDAIYIATEACKTAYNIADRMSKFETLVEAALSNMLRASRRKNPSYFKSSLQDKTVLQAAFFGFERGSPYLKVRSYKCRLSSGQVVVEVERQGCQSQCDMLTILGESRAIEQYVSQTPSNKKRPPVELVKVFTSLGFDPLPQTFWERSLFTKPQDRDVVCHASAWDIDNQMDVRLKMCIKINYKDFQTIHHELWRNYFQMAYALQSPLYQNSANDGFHEAIGDAIALSVTPEYLKKIGLIVTVPPESADIGLLLKPALDKVAFLPFGYLVDQWQWKDFSGEVGPGDYNKAGWELREKDQGIAPPAHRGESDFDAGAKYHVPANDPYARYFLAHILQFQFHRAMCREAGYLGPLNRCSIYGDKQAGEN